jgi:hypothetical protein
VASAIRLLAKATLTENGNLLKNYSEEVNVGQIRGHLLGEYGLGRDIILDLREGSCDET